MYKANVLDFLLVISGIALIIIPAIPACAAISTCPIAGALTVFCVISFGKAIKFISETC